MNKEDWIFKALKYLITISDPEGTDLEMYRTDLLNDHFKIMHPKDETKLIDNCAKEFVESESDETKLKPFDNSNDVGYVEAEKRKMETGMDDETKEILGLNDNFTKSENSEGENYLKNLYKKADSNFTKAEHHAHHTNCPLDNDTKSEEEVIKK